MGSSEDPSAGAANAGQAAPLAEASLGELLELFAERTPSPGGGSAAALTGAVAAALSEMAAAFALEREHREDTEMAALRVRAATLRARLLELADSDRGAYRPVLEALALGREDPRRTEALCASLSAAAQVPLEITVASADVAALANALASAPGNAALTGDASAAVILAEAAASAAATLVRLNLQGSPADARADQAQALAHGAARLRAELG